MLTVSPLTVLLVFRDFFSASLWGKKSLRILFTKERKNYSGYDQEYALEIFGKETQNLKTLNLTPHRKTKQ